MPKFLKLKNIYGEKKEYFNSDIIRKEKEL